MKNFDDDFFDLLGEMDVESSPITDDEIERIYSIEIEKISNTNISNPSKHVKKISIKMLLIASIITFGTLTVFAAYNKISNIFAGVFKEQNTKGEIVNIEKNIPIVEKAGAIINESTSANGLDISVKGVVGDNDTIYLMLDVINPSGIPLKSAKNKSKDIGQLKFNSAYLHIDVGQEENFYVSGQYCWTDLIKIDNNKATFLINEKTRYEDIVGKKATLILQDLVEYIAPNAKEIDMTYENLYDIYTQFKEEPIFIDEISSKESNILVALDDNGEIVPILKSGNEKISFSNKFKDLSITNMAFKDDIFYMNFLLNSNKDINNYLSLAFKNINTGEIVQFYRSSSNSNLDNGKIVSSELRIESDKITSPSQLKDYIIVTDADYKFEPVVEGEWKFEFNLDYENTTETYTINQNLNNGLGYVDKITISPISMNMKLKTDIQDNYSIGNIKLIMNDGSIIDNIGNNYYTSEYNEKTKIADLRYILPYVVNVSEIKSIQIDDFIIELK